MGLIKFDGNIESITGGLGGVYFSRDASGAHVMAKPRTTKRAASHKADYQRKWYTSKKYAERWPYPDVGFPDDEIPPGTHVVYSLETIWGHKQPSFSKPTYNECTQYGYWPDFLWDWINAIWDTRWLDWGLTKQLMFWMTIKWFYIYKYTMGMSSAVAATFAKAHMLDWIAASAAAVAVPLLTLWVGIIALGFYFGFTSWLEGCSGHINFNPGRVLVRKGIDLWWGGLEGRPSPKMYDIAICGVSPFPGNVHKMTPAPHPYKIHWFWTNRLWQTVDLGIIYNNIFTWKVVRCRFRGMGYRIAPDLIRMQVSESQHAFWNKPIGWSQSFEAACAYTGQIHDYFRCAGDPGPPL